MTILICICDFCYQCDFMQIDNTNSLTKLSTAKWNGRRLPTNANNKKYKNQLCKTGKTLKTLYLTVDGISAFYLLREIKEFTEFRLRLMENPALREMELMWLQLVPPKREIIDYKWNEMLARTLWEKIEADYMMSWLSTLGGGYSALGEQYSRCAETAGKISLKQLAIGLRLGDPFLQARCKLYYSISLIQTGRLKQAKHLVREQYKFAITVKEVDGRLVNMCKGIWLRIQYEYFLRTQEKERHKELTFAAGDK